MAFTYFFRDLQTLEAISQYAFPFLRSKAVIRIWDAGCASGQEPFSLAITFYENIGDVYPGNVSILATDIDESDRFANIISEGVYPESLVQRIPKDIFSRYFDPDIHKDLHYKLKEHIRKSVTFKKHDLLTLIPPEKEFGLILCKNVLLHFNEEQRVNVIRMFHESLIDGGFLAMEQTQKLPLEVQHLFQKVASNVQLFQKI